MLRSLMIPALLMVAAVAAAQGAAIGGKGKPAQSLSASSHGELLIFPYYGARPGGMTRFAISNPSSTPKALSIRIVEALNARRVLGWNGYLLAGQTQSYRIEPSGSEVRIFHERGGCTAPVFSTAGEPGRTTDIFNDEGPDDPSRMQEGFIYVFATADLTGVPLAQLRAGDCEALAFRFSLSQPWDADPRFDTTLPLGDITGSSELTPPGSRRSITLVPTAIRGFADDILHARPVSDFPDLQDGRAFAVIDDTAVEYPFPVEALSALLMQRSTRLPTYADGTTWGATYPTRKYFTAANDAIGTPLPVPPFHGETFVGCELAGITLPAGGDAQPIVNACNGVNVFPLNGAEGDLGSTLVPDDQPRDQVVGTGYGFLAYEQGDLVDDTGGLVLDGIPVVPFSLRTSERIQTRDRVTPPNDLRASDRFGAAMAGRADALVVSLPGADRVATYGVRGRVLIEEGLIRPPADFAAAFGSQLAVGGDTLLIGGNAASADRKGLVNVQVAIYERLGQEWQYKANVESPPLSPAALFGAAIAVEGQNIAVSAPGAGNGQLFLYDGSGFQTGTVSAAPGIAGLGASLAIKNGMMAAGAPASDIAGAFAGAVSLYDAISGNLMTQALPSDADPGSGFGNAVQLEGPLMAVGAPSASGAGGGNQGAVYLFDLDPMGKGGSMTERIRIDPPDGGSDDGFGTAVAISGTRVAIGAPRALGTAGRTGAVYLFDTALDPPLLLEKYAPDDPTIVGYGTSLVLLEDLLVGGAPETEEASGAALVLEEGERLFVDSYEE